MPQPPQLDILIVGGNLIGKGAEAMLLTVANALSSEWPHAHLHALINRPEDAQPLQALGLHPLVCPRHLTPGQLIKMSLTATGLIHRRLHSSDNLIAPWQAGRFLIDISGFKSTDQIPTRHALRRWLEMKIAHRADARLLFLPQAWGPFERFGPRFFTRSMLRHADLLCARDQISYDHLTRLRCVDPDRCLLAPDIAFLFSPSTPDRARELLADAGQAASHETTQPLIAFTPNMRILERCPGRHEQNSYFAQLLDAIRFFRREFNARILLIPHEDTVNKPNDPQLCRDLAERFPDDSHVAVLPASLSAADVKAVIGLADLLVASRYHSLIAALSLRVPAVVIGWSHKYDILMHEVTLDQWVADPVRRSETTTDTLDIIRNAWQQRDAIRQTLADRVPTLEQNARRALDAMLDVIRKTQGAS